MKNKYVLRSKISEAKFRQLVRFFCVDLTATQIALVAGLNRNTVNRLLQGIRERIAFACEAESPVSGEVEVDESYFNLAGSEIFEGEGPEAKLLFLACLKGKDAFTRKSFQIAPEPPCKALSVAALTLKV